MTANQIAYKNARETERHNVATEAELSRHQKMTEQLQRWSNALNEWQIAVNNAHYTRMDQETERANRAREAQNLLGYSETARSNQANEAIKAQSNRIAAMQAQETSRHQRATEAETKRYNDAIIEKTGAETEQTRYTTTILMPSQVKQVDTQTGLYAAQSAVQPTVQYKNVMEGTASVISSFGNVLRGISSLTPLGGSGNAVQNSFNEIFSQLQ